MNARVSTRSSAVERADDPGEGRLAARQLDDDAAVPVAVQVAEAAEQLGAASCRAPPIGARTWAPS